MKVRLIKSCTYFAHPFTFSKTNKVEDVPEELADHLLQTGYFEKIEEDSGSKKENQELEDDKDKKEDTKTKDSKSKKSKETKEEK